MQTIDIRKQSARKIDMEKRELETPIIRKLKSTFRNMATDASTLYRVTGNVNAHALAQNYRAEFLTTIRESYRKSIRKFGFEIRDTLEKRKSMFFNVEHKKDCLELCYKQKVTIEDATVDEKFEQVNNQFQLSITDFVANQSEVDADYVTDTNERQIELAIALGLIQYQQRQTQSQRQLANTQNALQNTTTPQQRRKLERELSNINNEIERTARNQQGIVSQSIEGNLINKSQSRSELIAENTIGKAESFSRQEEALLINNARFTNNQNNIITIQKEWVTILDNHTRESHVMADGQIQDINNAFTVGGEQLQFPRDPNGSAGNTINCRCVDTHIVL